MPFIKNYTAKEINASAANWAAVQDERGIMYFGNNQGLLEYDGVIWRFFPCQNQSIIRSIAIGKNKNIYVGAVNEIGYYTANKIGELVYNSLNNKIPKQFLDFSDVWKTYSLNNKIIFVTNKYIFVLENDKINVILPEQTFHFAYIVNNEFYVLERGVGLMKLLSKKLEIIPNGSFFADDKIYSMLPKNDSDILVVTRRGIFTYHNPKKSTKFVEPFGNKFLNDFVINNEIYNGVLLNNGNLCFGTLLGGAIIVDKDGNTEILNEASGLQDRCIKYSFEDSENNLWLCLDNGISLVKASSQITVFNKASALPGRIKSIFKNNNFIYCNTAKYLYAAPLQNNKNQILFKEIASPADICNKIKPFYIQNKEHILLTTYSGIYEINATDTKQITDFPATSITQTAYNENLFWIAGSEGVALMMFKKNVWEIVFVEPFFEGKKIEKIVEIDTTQVLISTSNEGVYMANVANYALQNIKKVTDTELDFERFNIPFFYKKELLISKLVGLVKLNKQTRKFEKCNYFGGSKYQSGQLQPAIFDKQFNFITSYNDVNGYKKIKYFENNKGVFNEKTTELAAFENLTVNDFFIDDDNIIWIASDDGLYRFENNNFFTKKPFNSLIRQVTAGTEIVFDGLFINQNHIEYYQNNDVNVEISYHNNSIKLDFAAPQFFYEKDLKYSFYLEGLQENFGEYKSVNTQDYTKLHEGNYTFHVKAINNFGFVSKEFTYSFSILPPWYRSWFAYIIYFVFIILIIYGIVQLSVYRLKKTKQILENTVAIRTKEIVLEKENVEKQKKIVEEKNQDITDSINYAQRIQQAILPVDDDIKMQMPESFILFKPRDIVSGDFYWYKKISENEFLIACVDCTGHGVPGAFMSMIGNTLLNEIVNQKKIFEPGLILNELHLGVRLALKQDQELTQSRDGMDIALIKFNIQSNVLEFAAANRPLYIVTNNGELEEVKADKYAIGGIQGVDDRKFTNNVIQMQKGYSFYATSDGFPDQFGGPLGKKYMIKKLKEQIAANHSMSTIEQYNFYKSEIENWMIGYQQIDDILLMGFKVL